MAATLSETTSIADDELESLVATLAAEHSERSEWSGRQRSRKAFASMGEPIPSELSEARDIDLLRQDHECYWLASAAGFVRGLDPCGLGCEPLHVVSTEQLNVSANGTSGFVLPGRGMFDAVRGSLPVSASPGPVIVVSTTAILSASLPSMPEDSTEAVIRESGRVWTTAVVMHEAGHVIEQAAAGLEVPAGLTMTAIRMLQARPRQRNQHTATWARAFGHLAARAAARPPAGYWQSFAAFDIQCDIPGGCDEWQQLLAGEVAATDPNEPLVDVIRRPNPEFDAAIERRRSTTPVR